jgi:hypothetical protein
MCHSSVGLGLGLGQVYGHGWVGTQKEERVPPGETPAPSSKTGDDYRRFDFLVPGDPLSDTPSRVFVRGCLETLSVG